VFNEYTKQKQYNRKIRYIITEERMNKNLLLSGMVVLLLIIVGLSGCEEELSQDDETIYAELNVPFRVGDYNVVFSNVHYSKYAYFEGWRWVEIDVKVTNSYGKQASSIYLYAPSIGVSGGYFYNGFGPDTYFTAIEHPFESYETNFRYRIPNNRSAIRLNITYKLDMLQENSIPIVLEDFTTFIDYEKYLELKKLINQTRKEIKEFKYLVGELKLAIENKKHNLDPKVLIVLEKLKEAGAFNGSEFNEQQDSPKVRLRPKNYLQN